MSNSNLVWFNKKGDYLNFTYNQDTSRYEGDILFDENSSDTFRSFGLYMFEKVPSFEFELPGELTLDKFQLFNEFGIHFYGATYSNQSIQKIEPVNNDPNFYSKWIYGIDFESKFPLGTIINFDSNLLEFNNPNYTYTVIETKKNAIMIISQMDNSTFESIYYSVYTDPLTYINKSISGINILGIYNYIDPLFNNNFSNWSEPNFYDKYYDGKKLNLVNTQYNNNTVTINNSNIMDIMHYEYECLGVPTYSTLIMEVITKSDLPIIYSGSLNISGNNTISFGSVVPEILKPGSEFKIIGSTLNGNFLNVSSVPSFVGNVNLTYYATQSQVLWNNRIYECVSSYTQSATSSVNPGSSSFWALSSYLKVDESTVSESMSNCQVYLTSNHIYFDFGWTVSNSVTLASAAEKYKNDFGLFNIDLYYKFNKLKADLIYPSKYAEVNFYYDVISSTHSIGYNRDVYERAIGIRESLNTEYNYNYSNNHSYNIVFTDIDEFGIKIFINKMLYQIEVEWIYSGGFVDMERTIDRTIRNWFVKHYIRLSTLGILPELKYIGGFSSVYYNTIVLVTQYPNVPIDFSIEVGTTANFYIEHSTVLFTSLGGYLSININDRSYGISSLPSISDTLNAWIDEYQEILLSMDILVSSINELLSFNITNTHHRLSYTIQTGKSTLPGEYDYIITNKIKGNVGSLIASNEVIIPTSSTASLELAGFATGMVFSINNTIYPFDNQEYNIQYLDQYRLNLSYQGPFWGLTDSICNTSAYMSIAFSLGFGQTACNGLTGNGGQFNQFQFNWGFNGGVGGLYYYGGFDPFAFDPDEFDVIVGVVNDNNSYTDSTYDISSYTTNLVDLLYVQISDYIYVLGDDVVVMDPYSSIYVETIPLSASQSIKMQYNPIDGFLYCLTDLYLYVVDPLINSLTSTITLPYSAQDICVNTDNGDVYITHGTASVVSVYNGLSVISSIIPYGSWTNGGTFRMAYNKFEQDMYVTTGDSSDIVLRINGSTRTIQTTYVVPGLSSLTYTLSKKTHLILYEPINESIYVCGTNLMKIDNGVVVSTTILTTPFNDLLFNNLTGNIISSYKNNPSGPNYSSLDISTNLESQRSIVDYGYMTFNQYDGFVYLSSQVNNVILAIDSVAGVAIHSSTFSAISERIIYNPQRRSIWSIQPSIGHIAEVSVELNVSMNVISPTYSIVGENLYGTLDPEYIISDNLWLKTRDYIRRPRENYEGDSRVSYYWRWFSDNVPQFFLYDYSGTQLSSTGSYAYTGIKPLDTIILNTNPNKDVTKTSLAEYQQTVFDKIEFSLDYINDSYDISTEPEPMELFIGFNSVDEGALRSVLQLFKKEDIQFDIVTSLINNNIITFQTIVDADGTSYGQITMDILSDDTFINRGLRPGQILALIVKDNTNVKKQYISPNNGRMFKIRQVYNRTIVVDFINPSVDLLNIESTSIDNYPKSGQVTYLTTTFLICDVEIGRFTTYGQTEIEDIRFKTELTNIGKNIGSNEVFIFKDYDINEGGIDWTFLNKKRKEMLMMKHLIYSYIGSYKSIINAINYFGYNDLQLNEYYRNINIDSVNYNQLFKVEIPDIFDTTITGWTSNDFIKHTLPNKNYSATNLLNLTYDITNKNGDNILNYSLDEVIIKLQGLKYWLQRNIIPLTHKILDITGRSYFSGGSDILHKSNDISIFNVSQNMTPITLKMNESYLMPVSSGSTVYNCVIDFYSQTQSLVPDYFTLEIRTYKTYKEWAPFTTYNIGDKVIYYGKIYESQTSNNKVNNPRKYENSPEWNMNSVYVTTNVVSYNRSYYTYTGLGATSSLDPVLDSVNWLNITQWREIDFEPVQKLKEYRKINNLLPYNFTIDSNIDPFIVIKVISDNGYGVTYCDKKNYEVRGLKDLVDPIRYIDPIGPFQPISSI